MSASPAAPAGIPRGREALARAAFPALARGAYFNYGAQGPLPRAAAEAIASAYHYLDEHGPFSAETLAWVERQSRQTRADLAAVVGARAGSLALTESVSAACNVVLWGLDWRPGDHLVLSDGEHPSVLAVVAEIQHRFAIEVTTCPLLATPEGGDPVAIVCAALQPRTRLLILSHVIRGTGQVLPLAEIAGAGRALTGDRLRVLVDGAQAVGMLAVDAPALGVDFYAFTLHKWCCGPEGIAALYVAPRALDEVRPTFGGWRGVVIDEATGRIRWRPDARRYEVGTAPWPLLAGVRAALDVQAAWGSARERFQRLRATGANLWRRLEPLAARGCQRLTAAPPAAGIVVVTLADRSHGRVVRYLEGQSVLTRAMPDPPGVRFCVHYLTTEDDLDRLLNALDAYLPLEHERNRT